MKKLICFAAAISKRARRRNTTRVFHHRTGQHFSLLLSALAGFTFAIPDAAHATDSVWEVPRTWRLENYVGSSVVVWGVTAPACGNHLQFPSTATVDDKNRFWALVMSAKFANRGIGIYYTNPGCEIFSFYIEQ